MLALKSWISFWTLPI